MGWTTFGRHFFIFFQRERRGLFEGRQQMHSLCWPLASSPAAFSSGSGAFSSGRFREGLGWVEKCVEQLVSRACFVARCTVVIFCVGSRRSRREAGAASAHASAGSLPEARTVRGVPPPKGNYEQAADCSARLLHPLTAKLPSERFEVLLASSLASTLIL
jgi:hypothetical protein